MTPREVNALLAHAGLVDLRLAALLRDGEQDQPGSQAARVATEWAACLGDVSYDEALAVVRLHYASSTDSLLPAHIVEGVDVLRRAAAWEPPELTPAERELCEAAGVPAEEFVERRDDDEWVAHLRSKWLGVES